MLFYQISYFLILLLLAIIIYYRDKPHAVEGFINTFNNKIEQFKGLEGLKTIQNKLGITNNVEKKDTPLLKSIECSVNNEKQNSIITQFVNKNNDIFKTNHIEENLGIEISTKFSKSNINYERLSIFADFNILENKSLLSEILNQFKGDYDTPLKQIQEQDEILEEIETVLNNNISKKGQLIYGKDFKNNTNRVYINFEENNMYFINGFEWNNNIYKKKKYKSVENKTIIIKKLTSLFPSRIVDLFIKLFPEDSWETVLHKEESIKNTDKENNNTYYFTFNTDPLLIHVYSRLRPLLIEIYKDESEIDRWYECNKTELAVISWISLSINNQQPELNIYFTKIDKEQSLLHSMNKLKNVRNIN